MPVPVGGFGESDTVLGDGMWNDILEFDQNGYKY